MLIAADRIVTGHQVLRPGWLRVVGSAIAGLAAGPPPAPADLSFGTATIVPGFVDLHNHGGAFGAFGDVDADACAGNIRFHRSHGTTTMLASLGAAHPEQLLSRVSALAELVTDGLLAGIHLEGPWLAPARCGAHRLSALRDPDPAELDRVLQAGRGAVRMVTLAPELPGALAAIRQLVDAGVVAAIGHTDASYEQTRAGIEAGARVATHLGNAMRPIHQRDPGPIPALLGDERVMIELINDGVHLHSAMYRSWSSWAGPNRVALITDSVAAGLPDGSYRLTGLPVDVVDGVARVTGTDTIAGSTATMDLVFGNAVVNCGLDRASALELAVQQACVNPARTIGLDAGDLVVGGPADLVVLDDDLSVTGVLHQGAWQAEPKREPSPIPTRPVSVSPGRAPR